MTIFAEQNTHEMAQIRILHLDGRMVAINKNGIWHRLEAVSPKEFGIALQEGDVETLPSNEDTYHHDVVDFAVTLGACFLILICGFILFNVGC
jgi:hypothetical protein